MNMTFADAAMRQVTAPISAYTRTQNGMRALQSTMSANVDLFGSVAAMRGRNVVPMFEAAFQENPDVALRVMQYARDVRGGQGERKAFRDVLLHLEATRPDILVDSRLLDNVAEIGRFDDLLIFTNPKVRDKAFSVFAKALSERNALAAKWAPRKGPVAVALRNFLGLTPKRYRKTLVALTNVVETQMCAREFDSINFSHVPSIAMSRYMTAFHKRAPEAFTAYKEALKRGDKGVKVNAGAVYPYDVIKMLNFSHGAYNFRTGGYDYNVQDNTVAENMWKALPDYMNDASVLPIVDVSASMTWVEIAKGVQPYHVATSLGLYCAERNKGPFKDLVMMFTDNASVVKTSGSLAERVLQIRKGTVHGSTNLHAAFDKILNLAVANRLDENAMPKMLLVLSDMQFNACVRHDDTALQMMRRKYEAAGYEMPTVVFWNLNESGNKPVRFNEKGVALVSGFSPSVMKSILAADLDKFTPENVMLKAVMLDRYNW
jgi:hypothetical protein